MRLKLSRGTIIAANIGQATVNLKLWLSKSSSSHRQLHGCRGLNSQSLVCEPHTLPLGYHAASHFYFLGTEHGMSETFGTTCHGAGRALSRAKSRRNLDYTDVLNKLQELGISIRVASPKLVMEEAPESYKNVTDVVDTCHAAGISEKCVKLRPIAVIKG